MKRTSIVFAATLLASLTPVLADSPSTTLPISRVTLYTSGVGYFERTGTVDGDASLPLSFPLDQVNDVLKSLVLLDEGGGAIRPVTYAAMDPVSKQLAAFGVNLSDNPDRATLLNRLRGARVTITCAATSAAPPVAISGVVLGVEQRDVVAAGPEGAKTMVAQLNLLGDDGLHSILLSSVDALKIDDPKLDHELREALQVVAQGRDDNQRSVTLNFDGKGKRKVMVAYVAEAPVWQTSYRLLLGKKPLLQGWGLVQNTTQEDWKNVALTLVSGKPISFIQDLYSPLYVHRQTIQSQLGESIAPTSYDANMNDKLETGAAVFAAAPVPSFVAPRAMPSLRGVERKVTSADAKQALGQSENTHGARLGESLFSYNIDEGVTIPRQQSAMIPFISSPITAERVAIYNEAVNTLHPLTGARLTNTSSLHLLGGPITVFDDNGTTSYAGDAIIDDTQPGQTRLVSFALDVPVSVNVKRGDTSGRYVSFKIAKGLLTTSSRTEQSTAYTIKNDSESTQTVIVEHAKPGDSWKLIEPVKPTEETQDVYRFDIAAPAGKSATFTVRESLVNSQTVALIDANLDAINVYMHDGAISSDVRQALEGAAERRQKVSDAQNVLNRLNGQVQKITDGQGRIRDNMRALDQASALYKRYVDELNTQEDTLIDLAAKIKAQQDVLTKAQADLANYVAGLNVG